jgi:hypothetical protein
MQTGRSLESDLGEDFSLGKLLGSSLNLSLLVYDGRELVLLFVLRRRLDLLSLGLAVVVTILLGADSFRFGRGLSCERSPNMVKRNRDNMDGVIRSAN